MTNSPEADTLRIVVPDDAPGSRRRRVGCLYYGAATPRASLHAVR